MKHYLILLGILFCIPRFATAQLPQSVPPDTVGYLKGMIDDPTLSFWEIDELAQHYLSTSQDPEAESFSKHYGRWRYFWGTRVDSSGDRSQANREVLESIEETQVCLGGPWQQADPFPRGKQVNGVITAVYAPPGQGPSPNEIFIGSNTGGMWHTEDGGDTWVCLTDELMCPALGVNSIVPDPNNSNVIYVATGITGAFQPRYGIGLFKYKKNVSGVWEWHPTGMTWAPGNSSTNNPGRASLKVLMDRDHTVTTQFPHTPVYVIAENSVFRSDDEGVNFFEVDLESIFPYAFAWQDHLMDIDMVRNHGPNQEEALFVTLYTNQNLATKKSRIFRKLNAGAGQNLANINDWSEVSLGSMGLGDPSGIESFFSATSDSEDGTLFVTGRSYIDGKPYLWRSVDLGVSFDKLEITPGNCAFVWCQRERPEFLVHPNNSQVMYFADNCLNQISQIDWTTPSQAVTATSISSYNEQNAHADIRAIQIYFPSQSGNDDVVLIGTDGGLSRRGFGTNASSWVRMEDNTSSNPSTGATPLVLTQYFDIANSSTKANFVSGGAQDNGWLYGPDQNGNYIHGYTGDGGQTIVDWSNSDIVYYKGNHRIDRRDLSIPANTHTASTGSGNVAPFSFRQDPHNPDIIYSGMNNNSLAHFVQMDFSTNPVTRSNFKDFSQESDFSTIQTFDVTSDINPKLLLTTSTGTGNSYWKGIKDVATNSISWSKGNGPNQVNQCTAIAIDPENSDRFWFGYAGFKQARVFATTDDGQTWASFEKLGASDPTNGQAYLPDLPINDLIYQEGSNDVLFAATDIGVYRYNPDEGYWECFNNGLPVCIVTDLEIDYCRNMLVVGTFGRGIWETPIDDVGPRKITQNTTWDAGTFRNIGQNIEVEPGVTLTIKGTVNMGNDRSIIVKPNARLIVDGGTLTNQCGGTWAGIEVWGDNTLHQSPFTQPFHQGKIEIINGALIEHAEVAVVAGRRYPGGTAPSGGLIIAKNSTFRNNLRACEFLQYKTNNSSRIVNCSFMIEETDLRFTDLFSAHVTLWDVRGGTVEGCTFENDLDGKSWSEEYSNGIFSIDAGYTVKGYCTANTSPYASCPTNSLIPSKFIGFNRGIRAGNTSSLNTVIIRDTEFDDNVMGTLVTKVDNIVISENEYNVGSTINPNSQNPNAKQEGLVLANSSGFSLEGNEFKKSSSALFETRGIRVTNAGQSSNEIYRNIFDGLDRGVLGEGVNRNLSIGVPGLQFLCNDFTLTNNSSIDIAATDQGNLQGGIQIIQGNLSLGYSAGNIFSQSNSGADNDVSNAAYSFVYGHHGATSQPTSYSTNKVFPAVMQTANPCTPTYQQGSVLLPLTPSAIGSLSSQFESADSSHAGILYNYNQLIDGGSTTQMLAQIQQSWSQGAWTLRNDLMAESPYVSEEVLRETAADNLLPQAMLLEVCLANPDATRQEGFLDFLESGISNPFPSYMIDMIVASWGTITARTLLEDGLAYFEREKAVAVNLLLSHYRTDSLDRTDSIRYWLKKRGDLSDHYSLAESFIATEEFDSCNTVLLNIPTLFQLDLPSLVSEHNDYLAYYQMRRTVHTEGRSIMELDSAEVQTLINLARGSDSRAAILADNILCFGYGICKDLSARDSSTSTARFAAPPIDAQKFIQSQYYQLRVYPNPATDYTTFEWDLVNLESAARINIMDATGRVIVTQPVDQLEGQWLWDTRGISRGLFLYELRDSEGTLKAQGKITLE